MFAVEHPTMNRLFSVPRMALILALGIGSAASAFAQQGMVNARVLSSTPVWQAVPVPGCAPGATPPTTGVGVVIGSVIGGLIGSQLGSGNGHTAGAVAGALGGAALGNLAEAQQRRDSMCAPRVENRLAGFDVVYEWNGQPHQIRTATAPGAWIQVPVNQASIPSQAPMPAYGAVTPMPPPPLGYAPAPMYTPGSSPNDVPAPGYVEQVPPAGPQASPPPDDYMPPPNAQPGDYAPAPDS
jgi:uncharacterized protein YcfJ